MILKSVREMTLTQPLQVGLGPKINKTKQTLSYLCCVNFMIPFRVIKFVVVSLVDPFFVDYEK